MQLALQQLRENPIESATTAARCYFIEKKTLLYTAWRQERKRNKRPRKLVGGGDQNQILCPNQYQAMIQYAADYVIEGKGATKQMLFNCTMYLRVQEKKSILTQQWFQKWLKSTPELYTIKTKPIASHYVNMHTKQDLCNWFETEYWLALKYTGIRSRKYIHNIDSVSSSADCSLKSGPKTFMQSEFKQLPYIKYVIYYNILPNLAM